MWETIIDQQRVVTALRGALARRRVAHAYLFHGPDGVGKRATALAFAQALQCTRAETPPCGRCLPCDKVRRMLHPDVHVLFPHPGDADIRDVAKRLQRLAENPYAAIDFVRRPALDDPTKTSNKQALYTVARINEDLRRAMSYKPVEGQYKIAVLTDAEQFRTEAANAFLKLLEEPAPQTVFILTTSRPDLLLPTVLSRCQRFRFDPLDATAIARALVAREGLPPDTADTIARMADGSYTRALDLAENAELMESRTLVLTFLRLAYSSSTDGVDKLIDLIEQLGRMGREQMKGLMGLMLSWLRDLLLYRTMGDNAPLVNVDQRASIRKFSENVRNADLEAMVGLVEEATYLIERNVHLHLVFTALAQALKQAMHGPHSGRLYLPLAEAEELAAAARL